MLKICCRVGPFGEELTTRLRTDLGKSPGTAASEALVRAGPALKAVGLLDLQQGLQH